MKVVDIATEIYIEQGSPSTTTIPAIAYWVRTKVGWLNAQVYEELSINDALEIMNKGAEITPELVSIIKQAYKVYDLELQIKSLSLAIATDGILSVTDNLGGTSFTRVNRSEVMKTITQSRKDELNELQRLINSYRSYSSVPSQVAGDDTQAGYSPLSPGYHPLMIRRY